MARWRAAQSARASSGPRIASTRGVVVAGAWDPVDGFRSGLEHVREAVPSSSVGGKPDVRVQWDPERNLHLKPLGHRSIQIGLAGRASQRYVEEWIVGITDITPLVHEIHALVRAGDLDEATARLPHERPYPL
ncbi:DUF4291 family protein [Actinosynnema sp. CA-248983]